MLKLFSPDECSLYRRITVYSTVHSSITFRRKMYKYCVLLFSSTFTPILFPQAIAADCKRVTVLKYFLEALCGQEEPLLAFKGGKYISVATSPSNQSMDERPRQDSLTEKEVSFVIIFYFSSGYLHLLKPPVTFISPCTHFLLNLTCLPICRRVLYPFLCLFCRVMMS